MHSTPPNFCRLHLMSCSTPMREFWNKYPCWSQKWSLYMLSWNYPCEFHVRKRLKFLPVSAVSKFWVSFWQVHQTTPKCTHAVHVTILAQIFLHLALPTRSAIFKLHSILRQMQRMALTSSRSKSNHVHRGYVECAWVLNMSLSCLS